MRLSSPRMSLQLTKTNSLNMNSNTTTNYDLDSSTNTNTSQILYRRQSQSIDGSLDQSYRTENRNMRVSLNIEELDIKQKKSKIGVQLGILEKSILCQRNQNTQDKIKRLNRSNTIKNRQNTKLTNANKITKTKKITIQYQNNLDNNKPQQQNTKIKTQKHNKIQQINSLNLQQLRNQDKQLYKLYLDLFHDYKQQLQLSKTYDNQIQLIGCGIQKEEQLQRQYNMEIDVLRDRQVQMEDRNTRMERQWVTAIRRVVEENCNNLEKNQ